MDVSVVDFPALILALLIAAAIATALLYAFREDDKRRAWIVAGVLAAVLSALGVVDLIRESPRETPLATPAFGGIIPVLGSLGMVRATHRIRMRYRWPLVFATALVLLFGGLLMGATLVPQLLAS